LSLEGANCAPTQYFPAGQGRQPLALVIGLAAYLPGRQGMHADFPARLCQPRAHGVQLAERGPGAKVLPGHVWHTAAPSAAALPPPQSTQDASVVAPDPEPTVPAGHLPQLSEPCAENCPLGQIWHVNVRPSPLATLKKPARHWHPARPVPPADVELGGQDWHATEPLTLYRPAAQLLQADAASPLKVPAGHSRQLASAVLLVVLENRPAVHFWHVSGRPSRGSPS
jgi:hypothetical protein